MSEQIDCPVRFLRKPLANPTSCDKRRELHDERGDFRDKLAYFTD